MVHVRWMLCIAKTEQIATWRVGDAKPASGVIVTVIITIIIHIIATISENQ